MTTLVANARGTRRQRHDGIMEIVPRDPVHLAVAEGLTLLALCAGAGMIGAALVRWLGPALVLLVVAAYGLAHLRRRPAAALPLHPAVAPSFTTLPAAGRPA